MFCGKLLNKKLSDVQGEYVVKVTYSSCGKRQSAWINEVCPPIIDLEGKSSGESLSFVFSPWQENAKVFKSQKDAYMYLSQAVEWRENVWKDGHRFLIQKVPKQAWVIQGGNESLLYFRPAYITYIEGSKAYLGEARNAKLYFSSKIANKVAKRFGCQAIKLTKQEFMEV